MLRESPSRAVCVQARVAASPCSRSWSRSSVLALDAFAGAATPPVGKRGIDVVQVEGYLDPPNVSLILDAIEEANAAPSTLLVLQVKSSGAIDTNIEEVVRAIQRSRVPGRGVGRAVGRRRQGRGDDPARRPRTSRSSRPARAQVPASRSGSTTRARAPAAGVRRPARDARRAQRPRSRRRARKLATVRLGSTAARDVGATNGVRPTVGELIVQLDGKTVTTAAGDVKLSTATVDRHRQGPPPAAQPGRRLQPPRPRRLAAAPADQPVDRLLPVRRRPRADRVRVLHRVDRPGRPGRRASAWSARSSGFSHLPVHWWALALLFFAMFGFAVDVQAGGLGGLDGHRRPSRSVDRVVVPLRRRRRSSTRVVGVPRGDRRGPCCSCSAA